MAKKGRKTAFSLRGFDLNHYRQSENYVHAIDLLYNKALQEFANLSSRISINPDKPFSFDDYPQTRKTAQQIVNNLAVQMQVVINKGSREQWLYACRKNDEFLAHIMNTSKVSKAMMEKWQDRNLEALETFQKRKVNGMDLSGRIWEYTGQFKEQMELGIDIGIGEGKSAQRLQRELRKFMVDPDLLFRRVRDKHGNLVLSKRAKSYHPGQGKYRSSYKNAMRLTRSEINMAYRESDQLRWQKLDFVVGYEIRLSNNHTLNGVPFVDICDELAGRYPKTFRFKGWHPQCRCHAVPIMMDDDEFNTDELNELKAALKGTEYKKFASKNEVTDVPDAFKRWVDNNLERVQNWKSPPYFIRDNFKGGKIDGGLKVVKPVIAPPPTPKPLSKPKEVDKPHPALRTTYKDPIEVADSINSINAELANKWFERGIHQLAATRNKNINGLTNLNGNIGLKPERLENVRSAMTKIGQGRSQDITEIEADSMATYWHEITHNRNKVGNVHKTRLQTQYMELANEYVARKTLPEFYSKLGCAKTPHPKFIDDRKSTGYNAMVTNYDFVIKTLKLDGTKVLETVKNHLFNQSYTIQKNGLVQGLIDGGLKKVNGQRATKTEVSKIVDLCGRGYPPGQIENWMKIYGFI